MHNRSQNFPSLRDVYVDKNYGLKWRMRYHFASGKNIFTAIVVLDIGLIAFGSVRKRTEF
jgi:hypothetical protein